jgi:Dynamin family
MSRAKQLISLFDVWMTEKVSPIAGARYPVELKSWFKELALIRGQIERPDEVRVALVGTTGAGKSTFLNAVLGQELLPVGVMEPCTAFVTLVRYSSNDEFQVKVDYLSEEDWRRDLRSFAALLLPGDEDSHSTESRRLINAARKRVQAVLGIKLGNDTNPNTLLDGPLPDQVQEIFSSGSSQTESVASESEMLPYLRKLIHGESNLWPMVKQVSISGPYECLQGGLELVDLPGLNDPNEARIEVTREFLRTSPFVWVMFSMIRGLTQDIQAILNEEKLLRTLVLSGAYSGLTLIGTKADDIDLNMAGPLGLNEEAGLTEIIGAYRSQTVDKAREQLEQMVHDLGAPSEIGETLDRMLRLARNVEVHATSAAAYCRLKGIGRRRKDYGLATIEETGIPGIHGLLRQISDESGSEFTARTVIERLDQLGAEIDLMQNADAVVVELAATYDIFRTMKSNHEDAMMRLRRKKGSKCDNDNDKQALELLRELGLPSS